MLKYLFVLVLMLTNLTSICLADNPVFTEPFEVSQPVESTADQRIEQWDMLDNSPYSIKADAHAWTITSGDPQVYIGVIDAGSCPENPSLQNSFVGGYDFVSHTSDPRVKNGNQHGCGVAGVIAGHRNATTGNTYEGVAPKIKIVALNVFGTKNSADLATIAEAIEWAIGNPVSGYPSNPHPVKAISMSLGTELTGGAEQSCTSPEAQLAQNALNDAYEKNIPVFVSGGNEAFDANRRVFPRCEHVIAIAATTEQGTKTSYTNFGDAIALAAPGGEGNKFYLATSGDGYVMGGYTSFAAPHVTGVAALLLSLPTHPKTVDEMATLLEATTQHFATVPNPEIGSGIVDAYQALRAVEARKSIGIGKIITSQDLELNSASCATEQVIPMKAIISDTLSNHIRITWHHQASRCVPESEYTVQYVVLNNEQKTISIFFGGDKNNPVGIYTTTWPTDYRCVLIDKHHKFGCLQLQKQS